MVYWLDGIRQLNWNFWWAGLQHPCTATKLILLVLSITVRDFFLWLCIGNCYLDD